MVSRTGRRAAFLRDKRGSVGPFFGLLVIPSLMVVGSAIDYGHAIAERAKLQAAADAASVAAVAPAGLNESQRIALALKIFNANLPGSLAGIIPTITAPNADTVVVDASSSVNTPFLSFASVPTLPVVANSKAEAVTSSTIETSTRKACLLALDPQSDDGIHVQGVNRVNFLNCWAHTNSSKPTAINGVGNAEAVGAGLSAVGGYTTSSPTIFTPVPTTGSAVTPDPFAVVGAYEAGTYTPTFTPPAKAVTCKASNLNLKKGTFTLDPGRYCGGIDIQAHATVTFNPGVYYIDNGEFNVQSGANVSGSNVLFYLEGANSKMQVIGGGTVELTGRTSGSSYVGFLAIAHPNANPMGESNIQGGGTFKMEGVIYMPKQRIEVSGSGDINNVTLNMFGMVAKDFYFRGNGVFNAKKHTGLGNIPDIMPNLLTNTATMRKTVLKHD